MVEKKNGLRVIRLPKKEEVDDGENSLNNRIEEIKGMLTGKLDRTVNAALMIVSFADDNELFLVFSPKLTFDQIKWLIFKALDSVTKHETISIVEEML